MANPFTEAFESDPRKFARVLAKRFFDSGGTLVLLIKAFVECVFDLGGTREMLIKCIDEVTAARMPGEGQARSVQQDHHKVADARQPNASGESQMCAAQKGQGGRADPARSPMVEGGQRSSAQQSHIAVAPLRHPIASAEATEGMPAKAKEPLPPARDPEELRFPVPGPAPTADDWQRRMDAAADVYWKSIKLRAKAWDYYRYKDLKNVRSINMRENLVADEVEAWGRDNRISDERLVCLTMPDSIMKAIQRRANEAILTRATLTTRRKQPTPGKRKAKQSKPGKRKAG